VSNDLRQAPLKPFSACAGRKYRHCMWQFSQADYVCWLWASAQLMELTEHLGFRMPACCARCCIVGMAGQPSDCFPQPAMAVTAAVKGATKHRQLVLRARRRHPRPAYASNLGHAPKSNQSRCPIVPTSRTPALRRPPCCKRHDTNPEGGAPTSTPGAAGPASNAGLPSGTH
jgi:hypothetical protein